ncbi:MAG: MFS transporter [Candidatus Brocadiia bacterium]
MTESASIEKKSSKSGYFRRNYYLGVANGTLAKLGFSFIDPHLVMAAFVYERTHSPALVGLLSALTFAGVLWPQLYISSLIEHRPRKKPFYVFMSFLRVAILLGLASSILFSAPGGSFWWLILFFVCWFAFRSAVGAAAMPFLDLVGQTIRPEKLGGFFAKRSFLGDSLSSVAAILVISPIIGHFVFPRDYAILAFIGTAVMALAWGLWSTADEEEDKNPPDRRAFGQVWRDGLSMLKENRNYRLLFFIRLMMRVNVLTLVFYVPYGVERLGAIGMAGIFVMIMRASKLLSSLFWGRLSDRKGNRVCLIGAAVLFAANPVVALLAPQLPELFHISLPVVGTELDLPKCVYLLSLCLVGLALSGNVVGTNAFLLESAPDDRRPSYIAFLNTCTFPLAFLSLIAGALITPQGPGLEILFGVVVVSGMLTLIAAVKLKAVREPAKVNEG